jgi:hypothetical protein
MNLLWLDLPIQTSTMASWVTKEGKAWAPHPLFSVWLDAIIAAWLGFSMTLSPLWLDYTSFQIIRPSNLV